MYLNDAKSPSSEPRSLLNRLALPLLVFLASSLLYLVNLDQAPASDELYHLLAARGLLEHGEPRIADGLYTRVFAYTWLIAQLFAWFGESVVVARLPSVFIMALLNTLLFVWLRREAGFTVAALATGLFALSPFAVAIAQFVRFYAAQMLFFLVACIFVYELARQRPPTVRQLASYGLPALAAFVAAIYLQPTTLFGIVGLSLWLLTAVGLPWLADPKVPNHRKLQAIAIGLTFGLAALALATGSGLLGDLLARYRATPGFLEPRANEFWFYHVFYVLYYPTLWPVIGLLCLAALATWPRLTWFAMVVFAVGFLLNSFAGPKSVRYLAYVQPFLFILFGLGLAALLPWIGRAAGAFKQQLATHLAAIGLSRYHLPQFLVWSSLLVMLLANGAFVRTAAQLADITMPPLVPQAEWQAARTTVEPLLEEVDVVVTMVELQTLYFWERYDILFSPSRLTEMADKSEFAADYRTGRPVISTQESLARLVDCTATGLFVGPTDRWRQRQFIDPETVRYIEGRMTRLDLPRNFNMVVFTWDRPSTDVPGEECAVIEAVLQ